MEKFTITKDHLKLSQRMYVGWDDCEFGAPAIDCKRPYGNGDVLDDIAEILGWKIKLNRDGDPELSQKQIEMGNLLHSEMKIVLQICLLTQKFKAGTYIKTNEYDSGSWKLVK